MLKKDWKRNLLSVHKLEKLLDSNGEKQMQHCGTPRALGVLFGASLPHAQHVRGFNMPLLYALPDTPVKKWFGSKCWSACIVFFSVAVKEFVPKQMRL
jgi:hypothetical protein